MAEYRLSPRARHDLEDIFDYTVIQWSAAQAVRYTDLIEAACSDLAEAPQRAQSAGHIRAGYRRYRSERHVVYFRLTSYGIAVIRILHQRMDMARYL